MGFNLYVNLLCLLALALLSCFFLLSVSAMNLITSSQFIRDPETVSSGGFKLGFFSPLNSTNRYVGIWYLSESTIIWVANRNQPLRDSSGVLTISEDGNLVVLNGQKQTVWSSNVSHVVSKSNPVAQLLDTGRLVLRDSCNGSTMWDSFQHPCYSFVPQMKHGGNPTTWEKFQLTSWKSPSDPSIGNFSASLERLDAAPEMFIWNGSCPYWCSGPWNKRIFMGIYWMKATYMDGFDLKEANGPIYLTYSLSNKSDFAVFKLNSQGKLIVSLVKKWSNGEETTTETPQPQASKCDCYGLRGPFGICNWQGSPICSCLSGFDLRNPEEWNESNWASGCARKAPLQCEMMKNGGAAHKEYGFLKLQMIKVPDFSERSNVLEDECRTQCLQNWSCIGYAYDSSMNYMSWGGFDLYVRLNCSEFDKNAYKRENKKTGMTKAIAITVTIETTAVAVFYFCWKWASKCTGKPHPKRQGESILGDLKHANLEELPLFDFELIATATQRFHPANKLGQGGFGPVYKGELQDGRQIAVKRLSRASGQGLEEFMNEVVVVSKLQHRNLVRLLGCCVERDEKILIYEYMPNKSLDTIIFDPHKVIFLDWRKRATIIEGIARALLYLHTDSRLKIIHRDIKASNILLDEELNPKLSDFGMAKIFRDNEEEANTRRVVGTYGYMSPEYAMEGLVSEKSDVYGFGVLLLEIVSGRRNTSYYNNELSLSLLGFAWKLWKEGNIISLIDPEIFDLRYHQDILRSIHTGLLCVQELARDRPTMDIVISMLKSDVVNLPTPRKPAFTKRQSILNAKSSKKNGLGSIYYATMTNIQGR